MNIVIRNQLIVQLIVLLINVWISNILALNSLEKNNVITKIIYIWHVHGINHNVN